MKKLIIPFLVCLIACSAALAQTQRNDYQKVDYIRVDQENVNQFLSFVTSDLKPGYDAMVESGDLKSWRVYKVLYPGGEESNYNFVVIATSSSLSVFGDSYSEMATAKVIPTSMGSNGDNDFRSLTKSVKSELWKVENSVPETDTVVEPSQFMTMDYMNVAPGKSFDYLMLEDEIAKPMHVERINRDRMHGWEVYSLIIPGGTNYGYNFATGNFFKNLEHIEFGFTNELIKQTMGENKNIPELFNTIYNTRDLVHRELWELVAHSE